MYALIQCLSEADIFTEFFKTEDDGLLARTYVTDQARVGHCEPPARIFDSTHHGWR